MPLLLLAATQVGCHSVPKGYGDACLWDDDCELGLHCSSFFGGRCTSGCTPYEGNSSCPGTPCAQDTAGFCDPVVQECALTCIKELGGCDDAGSCIDE